MDVRRYICGYCSTQLPREGLCGVLCSTMLYSAKNVYPRNVTLRIT